MVNWKHLCCFLHQPHCSTMNWELTYHHLKLVCDSYVSGATRAALNSQEAVDAFEQNPLQFMQEHDDLVARLDWPEGLAVSVCGTPSRAENPQYIITASSLMIPWPLLSEEESDHPSITLTPQNLENFTEDDFQTTFHITTGVFSSIIEAVDRTILPVIWTGIEEAGYDEEDYLFATQQVIEKELQKPMPDSLQFRVEKDSSQYKIKHVSTGDLSGLKWRITLPLPNPPVEVKTVAGKYLCPDCPDLLNTH